MNSHLNHQLFFDKNNMTKTEHQSLLVLLMQCTPFQQVKALFNTVDKPLTLYASCVTRNLVNSQHA
jgi:hypothetical protein